MKQEIEPKIARFYLVRHGDAYNEDGIQLDHFPLNNFGKIQSLQLARRLKDNKFDAMYCSKVQRSIDTCEIVNEMHKMKVTFSSALNEVGSEDWPQPGVISSPHIIKDFKTTINNIERTFKKMVKTSRQKDQKEIIVFTHGNWIRGLLTKILSNDNTKTFCHFVIHNTSLTIIDVDEKDYEYIITVSDAAHTHLFNTIV